MSIYKKNIILQIFCLVIFFYFNFKLFSVSEKDSRIDFAEPVGRFEQVPFNLKATPNQSSNTYTFELDMKASNISGVIQPGAELALLFGTYNTEPKIIDARIIISDSNCTFTSHQKRLIDNELASFTSENLCSINSDKDPFFTLKLTLQGTKNLAVWMRKESVGPFNESNLNLYFVQDHQRFNAIGSITNDEKPIQSQMRINKLAYLWGFDSHILIFKLIFELLLILWSIALYFILSNALKLATYSPAAMILGFYILLVGSTGVISILVPPLQAPDEVDHVLGYLLITGQNTRIPELEQMARSGHFERIKFHSEQIFKTSDMKHPYPVAWGSHVEQINPVTRSSVTPWLWHHYFQLLPKSMGISKTILSLRFFNSAIWCLGFLFALLFSVIFTRGFFNENFREISYFIFIPILPFFAMHVSDYSLSLTLVVTSILLLMQLPQVKNYSLLGAVTGLFIQLNLFSNRANIASLLVFIPLVWHALFCRIDWNSSLGAKYRRLLGMGAKFWFFAALFALMPTISPHETHINNFSNELSPMFQIIPSMRFFFTMDHYRYLGVFIVFAAWFGYAILSGIGFLFEFSVRAHIRAKFEQLAMICFKIILLFILIFPAFSLFISHLPHALNIEVSSRSTFREYFISLIKVIVTSIRLHDFDFYLQSSFWGGFGWLDSIPSQNFLALQNFILIIVLWKFIQYWKRNSPLYGIGISFQWILSASILLGALVFFNLNRINNIHGRYLVPIYLFSLGFMLIRRSVPKIHEQEWLTYDNKDWKFLAYPYFYCFVYSLLINRYLG